MLQVSDSIKNVNESSSQIIESIDQVSSSVQLAESSSVETARLVRHSENHIYASLIKIDHVIYKQHTYRALGDSSFAESVEALQKDHHQCRLGQWYDQEDKKQELQNNSAYSQLATPHALVHGASQMAYQEVITAEPNEDKIMQNMEQAEEASNMLISFLSKMVAEQNRD
ncbi:MAG: hypothetical protein GY787_14780 [Alteromonadales bacterium]|nr:hypothetical protein [Alteromonadales bacterium]